MQPGKPRFVKLSSRFVSILICLFVSSLLIGSFAPQAEANFIPVEPTATGLATGQSGPPAPGTNRQYDQMQYFY